jgi:hypothetical protein
MTQSTVKLFLKYFFLTYKKVFKARKVNLAYPGYPGVTKPDPIKSKV